MPSVHLNEICETPVDAVIFVSDYQTGCYEGWGDALSLIGDEVYGYNLGHCSCYGPIDSGGDFIAKVDDFVNSNNALLIGRYINCYETFCKLYEQYKKDGGVT